MLVKIIRKANRYRKHWIETRIAPICSRSAFLANLYYFLFSSAFSREHLAVLKGRVRYLNDTKKQKSNYFLLVRNTHRLEKGLLMRPRKPVFATKYLRETVDSFTHIWDHKADHPGSQHKWFKDVVGEYFDTVIADPLIAEQKGRFDRAVDAGSANTEAKSIPYFRTGYDPSVLNYEDYYKLTCRRRSVRWFLQKAVPRELINKAMLAARQSPSACNRQPFVFRVFDDPGLVSQLVKFPMGTKGYGHSIPVFVVIVGNLDAYASERDKHLIYIDGALAGMSFMLALETLGLSSCPINWPDIEERERKMEEFLGLEKYQRPVMCIGLGYPDPKGKVAFSEKRSLDQLISYNF